MVDHQFHRLLTSHLVFTTSSEILFGGLLFYHLRVLERLYGSRKYAAMLSVSTLLTTLLEVGALVVFKSLGWKMVPAGPYGAMFAALYMYQHDVPETDKFRILGITFSQKSFVYLFALQILAIQYPGSLLSALCGFMAGAIYASDVGHIKRWRFPAFFDQLANRIMVPLLTTDIPQRSSLPERFIGGINGAAAASASSPGPDTSNLGSAPTEITTVPSESIEMLVAMGFPRQQAEQVLRRVGGDMERAVQALI